MDKNAQISIFLILSVLIITIAVVIVAQQGIWIGDSLTGSDAWMVREFIASCLDQTSSGAVFGFFLQDPEVEVVPLIDEDGEVEWWPVWYDRGRIMLSDDVVSWIEDYARESQMGCTGIFTDIPFPVHGGDVSFDVNLAKDSVWFTLHQPVVAGKEQAQTVVADPYFEKVSARLSVMLEAARGILDWVREDPDQIPIEFMVDQSILHGLSVTFSYLEGENGTDTSTVVYQIKDLHAGQNIQKPYIQFIARME